MIAFTNQTLDFFYQLFWNPIVWVLETSYKQSWDWQKPECLHITPVCRVGSRETRVTDWQSASSVEVTTQLNKFLLEKACNCYYSLRVFKLYLGSFCLIETRKMDKQTTVLGLMALTHSWQLLEQPYSGLWLISQHLCHCHFVLPGCLCPIVLLGRLCPIVLLGRHIWHG